MRICGKPECTNPVFGTDKLTKVGYCKNHQYLRTDKKKPSVKALQTKIRSYMSKDIESLKTDIKEIMTRKGLEDWFMYVMRKIQDNPKCCNCGAFIPKAFYRAACAHILPKRKEYGCPSVATNRDNYLILGAGCGCHSKFDNSWDDAQKMKVWPLAVERFRLVFPEINKAEYKNIPDCLMELVEE